MPWKWLYTARLASEEGMAELPVRAKNAADAEQLARVWAGANLPGPVHVTVQIADPESKSPAALRSRFGRLTKPDVKFYGPGEVPPGAIDYRNGVPMYREPPASPADVDEAQRRLGISLPAEYRDFLLWSNGGQTTDGTMLLGADQIFCLDDAALAGAHPWLVAIGVNDAGDTLCIAPSAVVLMAHHDPPSLQPLNSTFDGWLEDSLA